MRTLIDVFKKIKYFFLLLFSKKKIVIYMSSDFDDPLEDFSDYM